MVSAYHFFRSYFSSIFLLYNSTDISCFNDYLYYTFYFFPVIVVVKLVGVDVWAMVRQ